MTDTLTTEELTNAAHYTQAINLLTHRTHQTTDPEAKTFLQNITPKFTTNKGRPIHINTKHWPHSTDLTLNTDPNNPHATRQLTYPLTGNIAENYIEDIIYKNCRVTTTSPITRGHTPTHKLIRYYNTHKKHLPPLTYSLNRPIDHLLHQITQHLTNGTLTTEEQITHQEAKGAVATIADTLNITHPATPKTTKPTTTSNPNPKHKEAPGNPRTHANSQGLHHTQKLILERINTLKNTTIRSSQT